MFVHDVCTLHAGQHLIGVSMVPIGRHPNGTQPPLGILGEAPANSSFRFANAADRPSTESGGQWCRCYEFLQQWVSIQTPGISSPTLQRPCAPARVRDMLTDQHSSGSVRPASCLCGLSAKGYSHAIVAQLKPTSSNGLKRTWFHWR